MSFRKSQASRLEEEQAKIDEVRRLIGPAASKFPCEWSDESILRFLRARNWNTKRGAKMLKETIKWRHAYKPEQIQWDDVAQEAETGKVYRANYVDKYGRTMLFMRPGFQVQSHMFITKLYVCGPVKRFLVDGNEVFSRINKITQLKKLMNAYCDRQSVDFNSIAFLFDDRRLHGEKTPDELEMEDGHEIDAMLPQTGGVTS